jgi:hypothetical protein
MFSQNKYIYGIIEETEFLKFSLLGIGDAEVYTINYRGLAAIVSDTELTEIDPTRRNVRAHTVVQDELLKKYTILPMSFGVIANSEAEFLLFLEKNYSALVSEFKRLSGKVEVELKIYWDREAMMKELEVENPEISRVRERVGLTSSLAEAQGLLVEAGQLVERIVQDWQSKYAQGAFDTLKRIAIDARLNNPVGLKNLLNASFLIDRSSEKEFQDEVYKLNTRYQDRVDFKYVGPLPPYNFVSLNLEPVRC